MADVTLKLAGLDRLRARLAHLPGAAQTGVSAGLRTLAQTAADDMRQALTQQAEGPSGPGTTPDDPSRRIAEAITVEADDSRAAVTVALPFAKDLEFGTSRMAARPFLRPAAARAGQGAPRVLAPHLADALKQDDP